MKIKVFLDFDSTVVDSIKRFVEIANEKFGLNKSSNDLGDYGFRNLYPNITKKEIFGIFEMEEFFDDRLEIMKDAYNTLYKHKDNFDFYISTASSGKNLVLKKNWVTEHLPFVKGVYVSSGNNKSNVDMRRSIQIDDTYECLKYTNSEIKILFKNYKNYAWQRHDNDSIYNVNSWDEIDDMLTYYLREGIN